MKKAVAESRESQTAEWEETRYFSQFHQQAQLSLRCFLYVILGLKLYFKQNLHPCTKDLKYLASSAATIKMFVWVIKCKNPSNVNDLILLIFKFRKLQMNCLLLLSNNNEIL